MVLDTVDPGGKLKRFQCFAPPPVATELDVDLLDYGLSQATRESLASVLREKGQVRSAVRAWSRAACSRTRSRPALLSPCTRCGRKRRAGRPLPAS